MEGNDLIRRAEAIEALEKSKERYFDRAVVIARMQDILRAIPSAQQKKGEVIPHRNYNYLSDYWCECGWHLGKKNDVNYCANCGKRVLWDKQTERREP